MTSNQINYWVNEERKRANQATEALERTKQIETQRSNIEREKLGVFNAQVNKADVAMRNLTSAYKAVQDRISKTGDLAKTILTTLG